MTTSDTVPRPEDYTAATEQAFTRCPTYTGLRLVSAEARHGFLIVRFEGPHHDHRGPYGAVIRLPSPHAGAASQEETPDDKAEDWAHKDLTMKTLRAYASSRNQERPYSRDGIWWLTDDRIPHRFTHTTELDR